MSQILAQLREAVCNSDSKEIDDIVFQLKNETTPDELSEFKKYYSACKMNFFSLLGESKLTYLEKQKLVNDISFVVSKDSNATILPQKRKAENHIEALERPLKKTKTDECSHENNINNFDNTKELLELGYTSQHIQSLNQLKDSKKIIPLLIELHQSKIILPHREDLYSIAIIGPENLRSYLNHSNSLRKLNFTSDEIYKLVKFKGAEKRIPLLIMHYEDFKRLKLTQLEIIKIFYNNTGIDAINKVLTYLPYLRKKECPLNCVKNITNHTTGSILKIIAENYLLFLPKDWEQLDLTIYNTGFYELKRHINQLIKEYGVQTETLNSVDIASVSTQIVTSSPNFFFQQVTTPPEGNSSNSKMDLTNFLN